MPIFGNRGFCPTCDADVTFIAHREWLRDRYVCSHCGRYPQ